MAPPCMPGSWVCRSKSRARCQSARAAFFGSGVNWTGFAVLSDQTGKSAYVCSDITGRPGRIRWENVGIDCASSVEPRRPCGGRQDAVPLKQVGLAFLPEIHKIGVTKLQSMYLRLKVLRRPSSGAVGMSTV